MPKALIVHAMLGRVRLKFPGKRGDLAFFERLVSVLSSYPLVHEVRANPVSESIVVRHSASAEQFRDVAIGLGLATAEDFAEPLTAGSMYPGSTPATGAEENVSALALAILSLLQFARGQPLSPASEHLWQALAMWERHMPRLALVLGGLGVLQAARGNLLGSGVSLMLYSFLLRQPTPTSDETLAEG